jgi:tellurite resistance protein TehA-like permease
MGALSSKVRENPDCMTTATVLWVLLITRVLRYRANLAADLRSHAKAPGFFTLVAAPCVLGNQCVLLFGGSAAGLVLWIVGVLFWLALSYAMVPGRMAPG